MLSTDACSIFALIVSEQLSGRVEDNVSALRLSAMNLWLISRCLQQTYVVKRTARVTELDDLNTSLKSVEPLVVEAAVSSSLQARLEVCASSVLETQDSSAGLVQILNE